MILRLDTTAPEQFVDISTEIERLCGEAGWRDGVLHAFCRHTTAGLTVNENADPDVRRDMLLALSVIVPEDLDYRHAEGNSPAHVKATLVGSAVSVPLRSGRLSLGRWQGVYFCEFDGPRRGREVELSLLRSG